MTAEEERTRLIGEIARVLRDGPVPDEARSAALTLIGWLARRMPGEPVSVCDLTRCRGLGLGGGYPRSSPGLGGGHPRPPALDAELGSDWSSMDEPPVSTINGPGLDLPRSAEAPVSRRSRSAR
jgi:hypothetical protein